jgi:hypothetical protein
MDFLTTICNYSININYVFSSSLRVLLNYGVIYNILCLLSDMSLPVELCGTVDSKINIATMLQAGVPRNHCSFLAGLKVILVVQNTWTSSGTNPASS